MVKKLAIIILILSASIGCKSKKEVDNSVYWDILTLNYEKSDFDATISYPYCFGGDSTISDAINLEIFTSLMSPLIDVDKNIGIDSAINIVYAEKRQDSVISRIHYELNSSCDIHQIDGYTSVKLFSYYYTGGANGVAKTKYLNFHNATGNIIPIDEIISLDDSLLEELRRRFCIDRDVSIAASAKEAQLFVEPKKLPFPKQIGFSSQGVVFFYNLYEIAPRATGAIEIIIPYDDVIFLEI